MMDSTFPTSDFLDMMPGASGMDDKAGTMFGGGRYAPRMPTDNWADDPVMSSYSTFNYSSQILSPPDFLSMPPADDNVYNKIAGGFDGLSFGGLANAQMLLKQQQERLGRVQDFQPADQDDDDSSEVSSSEDDAPVKVKQEKEEKTVSNKRARPSAKADAASSGSRKKSHPAAQRRKRSEMGERFHQLKLLAVPDGDKAPAIGRGNRGTNSKEAILRMAGHRFRVLQKQEQELSMRLARIKEQRQQQSSVDFASVYHNSAVARFTFATDGAIVDFNDVFASYLDMSREHLAYLSSTGESAFTLLHPEHLPSVFNAITCLLSGRSNMVPLLSLRTVSTPLQRQAVLHMMVWLSVSPSGATPARFDCLLVHAGWVNAQPGDFVRVLPAPF